MATLRLRHVNSFKNKRRKDGRTRYYFRRRGGKAVALPGLPGSETFMQAYGMALASVPTATKDIGASRTAPGTINALIVSYYQGGWVGLSKDTQKCRRAIIERFRVQHGDKGVATLQQAHIEKMLAAISKSSAQLQWLKTIKHLLAAAVPTMRKDNPAQGISRVKLPKSKGHHSWIDEEISQYREFWKLGTQQRLVLEFALETASRRNEVVRLGPQHIKNGRIRIARSKGSRDVDILMSSELREAVAAMPKAHLTFIHTKWGKPRSRYGLGADFPKWATAAGLPKRCRLHGLKKASLRRLAEDGATAHQLMAISGHRTLSEMQRYTEDVDRKLLADRGMAKKRTRA